MEFIYHRCKDYLLTDLALTEKEHIPYTEK